MNWNSLIILTLGFIALFIQSCKDPYANNSGNETGAIARSIQQDLDDGVSPLNNWKSEFPESDKHKYLSDHAHSSISFHTKHWEIVDLIGWFEEFEVIMYSDSADFSDAEIFAKVDARSIRMPNPKMVGSVKKPAYIDTENFPFVYF
jgi:hypothetical protein